MKKLLAAIVYVMLPWLFVPAPARAQNLIYSDFSSYNTNSFRLGTNEIGNSIVLGDTARNLTEFMLEYITPNDYLSSAVGIRLRFYLSNGPVIGGAPSPGIVLFDSGWYYNDPVGNIPISTNGFDLIYSSADGDFPPSGLFLPSSNITWTVEFQGLDAESELVVPLANAPAVGQATGAYWLYGPGGWSLLTNTFSANLLASFKAITTNNPPFITVQPSAQAATAGQPAAFQVTAAGSSPFAYQWQFNGANLTDNGRITGSSSNRLTITNTLFSDAGNYAVIVTNFYGSITSSVAALTVTNTGACDMAPTGIVSWWPGEGNAVDIEGGNNGTLEGGATFAPGKAGQAFSFNGVNQFVQIADSPALEPASVTLECWFDASNSTGALMGKPVGGGVADSYQLWMQNGNLSALVAGSSGGLNHAFTPVAGVWYHAAYTFDKNSQTQTLYLNGVPVATGSANVSIGYDSHPVLIGADNDNGSLVLPFDGEIDEASIYNRALAASEIQAIYDAGAAGKCASSVPPVITQPPVSQNIAVGNNVTFSVSGSSSTALTYQWAENGTNITGATGSDYVINNVQTNQAGNYSVAVANVYGTMTSSPAILAVGFAPVITLQPSGLTLLAGTNVTFTAAATGSAPLYYQWTDNGANVNGATNASLVLNSVQVADSGNYSLLVSNLFGTATSQTAVLTVYPAFLVLSWTNPPAIGYGTLLGGSQLDAVVNVAGSSVYSPPAGTLLYPGTATLTVVFTPNDTADYPVVTNNVSLVVLPGALTVTANNASRFYEQTNPVLTGIITGITNGDNLTALYTTTATTNSPPGSYPIIPTLIDPNGRLVNYTVTTNNGTLAVNQLIPMITWATPGSIVYGTALNGTQLDASANVDGSFAYTPASGAVPNAGTNTLRVVFTPLDTTNYASATDTVSLVVSPATLSVTANNATRAYGHANPAFSGTILGITNGDNITATYSCSAVSFVAPGTYAIAPSLVDPNNRLGNYTVTSTNGTLTVTAGSPPTFSFMTPNSGTTNGGTSVTLVGTGFELGAGVSIGGESASNVVVNSGTQITAQTPASSLGAMNVVMTNPDSTATTLTNGFTYTGTPPSITVQPATQAVALNSNAVFSVGALYPAGWQWRFNGGDLTDNDRITGSHGPVLTISGVTNYDAGSYQVVVTNAWGSVISSVATLSIIIPPTIVVQPRDQTVGLGGTANFTVGVNVTPPFTFQWFLNGVLIPGPTNSTLAIPNVQAANQGQQYSAMISNAAGSAMSSNATLNVLNYCASAHPSQAIYPMGSPVPITIQTYDCSSSLAVSNASVTLWITTGGTIRSYSGNTGAAGSTNVTFVPLATEVGTYAVAASLPGQNIPAAQGTFSLVGMSLSPNNLAVSLTPGVPSTNTISVNNLADVGLTGVRATLLGSTPGVQVTVSTPGVLAGNAINTLTLVMFAAANQAAQDPFKVQLTTDQGTTNVLSVTATVVPLVPVLVATPASLSATMVGGGQTLVNFYVANTGGVTSGPVQISLPSVPWLATVTSLPLPPIPPGQSNQVTLALTPALTLPIGPYPGSLDLISSNADASVPFQFNCVSDLTGSLLVTVQDELSYYGAGSPNVSNATVTVANYLTGSIITNVMTGPSGIELFNNITSAYYTVTVTAPDHNSYSDTLLVAADQTNDVNAFVSLQLVDYTWVVTPTVVPDHYTFTLDTTFQTAVPWPVVSVSPGSVDLCALQGESTQVDLTITNSGLIAAQSLNLYFGTHPDWSIIPLATSLGDLAPQSGITVPVLITPIGTSNGVPDSITAQLTYQVATPSSTNYALVPLYIYDANPTDCEPASVTPPPVPTTCLSCAGFSGGGGFNGINSGAGGGSGSNSGSTNSNPGNPINNPTPIPGTPTIATPSYSFQTPQSTLVQVELQIQQNAVIARDAFAASLKLANNAGATVSNLSVTITVYDAASNVVNSLFGIPSPTLSGLNAVDGTGVLANDATGSAAWTIVPTTNAAPTIATQFSIGGSFTYTLNGEPVTITLFPVPITVLPSPILNVDYFLQHDVYADDPFTPQIEPSIPFPLGIRVHNIGHGNALDFTITSAQPQIIENSNDLLVAFQLIGSEVGTNQSLSPSFTLDLGNIGAMDSSEGLWYMTSTLEGQFISFAATFQHVDDFGNTNTSLINSVRLHELNHVVEMTEPTDDGLPDFLVNDTTNVDALPDIVYSSDGTTAPVTSFANILPTGAPSAGVTNLTVTVPTASGWVYYEIVDPGNDDYPIVSVTRSDGVNLLVGPNVWQTPERLHMVPPKPDNLIHIFDYNPTGTYTVNYGQRTVVATTTTLGALSLSVYGQPVILAATVAPVPVAGTVQFEDDGLPLGNPALVDTNTGLAQYTNSTLSAGSHLITAVYSGTTGYDGSTSDTLTQIVNQATTIITTAPTASPITFGQTLASSTLSGGVASAAGSFAFTTPSVAPGAGTAAQSVTFTPADTNDYSAAFTTASVLVNKGTPTIITAPTASTVTYGQTLASSALSGGLGSVAGNFNFTTPSTVPGLGTAPQSVIFAPTDSADYNPVFITINVTAIKGTPTITTPPVASNITYGEPLASSTLTGGSASVAGSFSFTSPATIPGIGTATQSVTFTPGDTTDYNTILTSVSVTVNPAPTTVTWTNPAPINYGVALDTNQLNATAGISGTIVYLPPTGTVLNAGTNVLSLVFTPNDTLDYGSATDTVSLVVLPAALSVTANNASRLYGVTNPVFSGAITGITNGDDLTAIYTTPAISNSPAGLYPIIPVLVDPNGRLANYIVTTNDGTLTVGQNVLTITALNTNKLYGQTVVFQGTEFSATGLVGADTITNVALTSDGTDPAADVFDSPYDIVPGAALGNGLTNYAINYVNGLLSVARAPLSVTPSNAFRPYGQTNPVFSGIIIGIQNNDDITATYATTATTNSPVKNYPIFATLEDPDGSLDNYIVTFNNGILTVGKATPVITWAAPAALTYGAMLGGAQLDASNTVAGTLVYTPVAGTVLNAGTNTLTVVFAPTDTVDYTRATNTVSQVVLPAPLTVTPNNAARLYGQTNPVFTGTITGLQNGDGITATYASSATTNSPVGTYPITATLLDPGDRLPNYTVMATNGTLTISPAASLVTWPSPAAIVYGTALGATQLGATASVSGSFAYAPAAGTVLPAGTNALTAVFTPADPVDYNGATSVVSLVVFPAPLTVTANSTNQPYTGIAFSGGSGVTYAGFVNGDTAAVLGGSLAYGGTAQGAISVGSYTITPSGLTAANYTITFAGGALDIGLPPQITSQPTNQIVFPGTTVQFTVTATGQAPLTYQWWFNQTNALAAATNSTLTLTNISMVETGGYSVVVMNDFGSVTSTPAVLALVSAPMISDLSDFFSSTNPATGSRTVTLNATVNPEGLPTTTFFQYGLTASYAGGTAPVNLPASGAGNPVSASLDSIVPGVVYHWSVVASNSLGGVSTPDQTFYTPSIYPPGETNASGSVDQNELNAVLANYWPNSPWVTMTNVVGLGTTTVQFALTNASAWDFNVQVSTNLIDWQNIGVAIPVYEFIDPQATNGPQRFYRLQWP